MKHKKFIPTERCKDCANLKDSICDVFWVADKDCTGYRREGDKVTLKRLDKLLASYARNGYVPK